VKTHALLMNGRTWGDAQPLERGGGDDIGRMLRNFDGTMAFALLLWKLPPGKRLDDVKSPDEAANEYIQCAGSADRMTCEVRRLRGGQYEHLVLGHAPDGDNLGNKETIHWDDVETLVAPNEVFSADEAAELFLSYYRTGWVPSKYVLRPVST